LDLGQDVRVGRPDDIRLSFNEVAEVYNGVRPSYPADLFDALFQMLPSQRKIVEVGPGTGQATKDLLARGASVLAIEIGPAMAAQLRSNLPSDRLRVGVGDFEVMEIVAGEATPCSLPRPATGSLERRRPIGPLRSYDRVASWRSLM
jgi:SAM-dependent methyltransferase